MRKTVAGLLVVLALAGITTPATAGKKKLQATFGASLLPFPKLAAWGDPAGLTRPGCSAGQENVNWVGQEFTPPANGTLHLYMEGFTGDHDIYVYQGDLALARGEQSQVPDGAPPEEDITIPLKAKKPVLLVACNWLGQPEVEANYEFTFTK
jgi:hypothetical protein